MTIHLLEAEDIPFLAALQPEDWGDITPAIVFYTSNSNCFPVKVLVNNQIVGIGTSIILNDTAWLAHIIVHENYRGKGIGTFITKSLVDGIFLKNIATIQLIATEPGERVYKKAGFETDTEYVFFKDISIFNISATSPHIIAFTDAFTKQVLDSDRQITGEDRSAFLKPHLQTGFLYTHNNLVEGFYLPTFGEGWIAAHTAAAGEALMQLRFSTRQNASFPVNNSTAINFLKQHEIQPFKRAKRMWLGAKSNWQPANIYNRVGGNLG